MHSAWANGCVILVLVAIGFAHDTFLVNAKAPDPLAEYTVERGVANSVNGRSSGNQTGTVAPSAHYSFAPQTGLSVLDAADTTGPAVSVTSHSDGQTVTTSAIMLRGTASDSGRGNSGIRYVTVNGLRANNDTAVGSSTAYWSRSVTLIPGANTITVVACDNSQNTNTAVVRLTIQYSIPDTAGPVVSIISHTNDQTVATSTITLLGTATDAGRGNNGIRSVTVNGERAANDTAVGSGTANWSKTLTLNPGSNTLTVNALDNSVNLNATTIGLTINYAPPDTTGPSISVTSHADGQLVDSDEIVLAGSACDLSRGDNGVRSVEVNGERANNDVTTGAGTVFWSKSVNLVPGANTITVTARDNSAARNVTTTNLVIYYAPATLVAGTADRVCMEDSMPECASNAASGTWEWINRDPVPVSGSLALRVRQGPGLRSWWFAGAKRPFHVKIGDSLVVYVYLNPSARPRMIMVQWREGISWEHRAYWGEDLFPREWTKGEPASKVRIGGLPPTGQWVRLEVPARLVELEDKDVNGVSLNVHDGEAAWDHLAKTAPARDQLWVGDDVPDNSKTEAFWADAWIWTNANPAPYFGTRAHVSAPSGEMSTHFVLVGKPGWQINPDDSLFTYVHLDRASPPKMIMVQWWDGSWEHRAYWGEDKFPNTWTKGERTSKVRIGSLPARGQWVRLSVPASVVGLENRQVTGVAFTVYGGKACWDNTGKAIPSSDHVWVSDSLPSGAVGQSYTGETWTWVSSNPEPFSGNKAHVSPSATGLRGHFFTNAKDALQVDRGDHLMAYVYINPTNAPRMIMLQWNDGATNSPWGHRAYWGENLFPYGADGPPERCYMGPVPPGGKWVRLEVPARLVGLEGKLVRGMSFDRYGGEVAWDHAGKSSALLEEDVVWLADKLPAGAKTDAFNEAGWEWAETPSPIVGELSHKSPLSLQASLPRQYHHHLFLGSSPETVNPGDKLFAYVYLDAANPPQMVMLQWNDGLWNHRAYWGENRFPWGKDAPPDRCYAGPLPPTGQWVRLEVPASLVALENRAVAGMAFSLYGGQAWWGHAGKQPVVAQPYLPTDDWVWVDDDLPAGATRMASTGDDWIWTTEEPGPVSGAFLHKSKWAAPGTVRSHYFAYYSGQPIQPMTVNSGDELFCYVYLDPYAPPQMIMLQWRNGASWEHRAYWGADLFKYGEGHATSKVYIGILPPAGKWVRLRVPARTVGLEGKTVNGMSFTAAGGQVWWDRAGKRSGTSGAGLFADKRTDGSLWTVEPWTAPKEPLSEHTANLFAQCVLDGDFFHGTIRGVPFGLYEIEASTNLIEWTTIAIVRAPVSGMVTFVDQKASDYGARFYRAKAAAESVQQSMTRFR
ncbi:MAG TPA: hypothetical protein PLW35_05935 [Verrucomicrobiota bacterium]|nr:hypothetical protein [Verrucomicrobiota bacterium]